MELDAHLPQDIQVDANNQANISLEPLNIRCTEETPPCCRICHTSGSSEESGELIKSPCDCRGSLGFVHKLCIETWLSSRNLETCELCHFKFMTERRLIPLREWNVDEILDSLSSDEKIFLLLGTVNLIFILIEIPFLYFVIKMNWTYFSQKQTEAIKEPRVYQVLLLVLLLFTVCLVVASIVFLTYGFKVFQKVLSYNREVFLVVPGESLERSFQKDEAVV